jgi:hypothetical protein
MRNNPRERRGERRNKPYSAAALRVYEPGLKSPCRGFAQLCEHEPCHWSQTRREPRHCWPSGNSRAERRRDLSACSYSAGIAKREVLRIRALRLSPDTDKGDARARTPHSSQRAELQKHIGECLGAAFGLAMRYGCAIGGPPFTRYASFGAGLITIEAGRLAHTSLLAARGLNAAR